MNTMLKGLAWMSAFNATAKDRHDEKGAAFTEYVVLLAIIVAVVVGLLWALQEPLTNAIDGVVTKLNGAGTPPVATP